MNWLKRLLPKMRPMNGFEKWDFQRRPRYCLECGKRMTWRVGRRRDGKVYRILACFAGEGAVGWALDGQTGHEHFSWTQDEEFGDDPFEE